MYFSNLVNEIQNYFEKSNSDIQKSSVSLLYRINVDGSFIPLEDNKWGLRSWYAINEEIDDVESEEEKE